MHLRMIKLRIMYEYLCIFIIEAVLIAPKSFVIIND